MFADKFKHSKSIEISKYIKKYVSKNYDINAFNKIESLINDLEFFRNSIISFEGVELTKDSLTKIKNNILDYLRLLSTIKKRIPFGSDDNSVKIEYKWYDVLKDDSYCSYNFNHEYYNHLFNLAVCLVNIAKTSNFTDSEEDLKVAVKNFNYAAWIFDKIKQELPNFINTKEIMPDMNLNYLTYCNNLCLAQSQAIIFEISGRKGMSNELQAQLSRGIYDLLTNCYNMTNDGLKKYSNDTIKTYLNNRRFWYFSLGLLKMRSHQEEEFKSKAIGYGKMIAYTSLAKDALTSGSKDMKYIEKLIKVDEYNAKLKQVTDEFQTMSDKNKRIYYDGVPDPTTLPKIEKKLMANPVAFNEPLTTNQYDELLKDLIPQEIRASVENYKEKLLQYVGEKLSNYENEVKIDKFLADLNLPGGLESAMCQNEISQYLWKKISDVQVQGGYNYLNTLNSNNNLIAEEIVKKLKVQQTLLLSEEDQDNKLREIYKNGWKRDPSNKLNQSYINLIITMNNKIEAAKNCDKKILESINEKVKDLEELALSKTQLDKKVPIKVDSKEFLEIPEAKALKEEIEKLNQLKLKNKSAIEAIFTSMNEENLITHFLDFHRKLASESAYTKEQYEKYDKMILDVANLEKLISESKENVKVKNYEFLKVKDQKMKPKPENEEYFKKLENTCNFYNEKMTNFYQGLNFYNSLLDKVYDLESNVGDFILARDLQKTDLMKMQSKNYQGDTYDFTGKSNNNINNNNVNSKLSLFRL